MAEEILETWYLSVVPAAVFIKTALVGTRKLKAALAELNCFVETRADLRTVKEAINTNMRLAVIMIAEAAAFLCAWVLFFALWANPRAVVMHAFIFDAAAAALWLYVRKVERDFRAIRVASDYPSIALTFETWLRQRRGPRLRLPD